MPPSSYNMTSHARECRELCQSTLLCNEFRFWADGRCSLHQDNNETSTMSVILSDNHGQDTTATPATPATPQRRRALANSKRQPAFSKQDFEVLPGHIRGNIGYEMVRVAYETMQDIWDDAPFKPIYTADLAKWGAVYPGRSEGRVIASLKKMNVIGQKRDGGLMLRHYPGRQTEIRSQTGVSPWHPQKISSLTSDDDDRMGADELRGPRDKALRYVAGSRFCSKRSLPVVLMAPFIPVLTRQDPTHSGKSKLEKDSTRWEENRAPLHSGCYFESKGSTQSVVVKEEDEFEGRSQVLKMREVLSPRICQANCATEPRCFFFSYSGAEKKCSMHGRGVERMAAVEDPENNWCGSSPLCPYLHILTGTRRDRALRLDGVEPMNDKYICSETSANHSKFPWPFFNEFGLEAQMLRKWSSSLFACHPNAKNNKCSNEADIVVVPSLYMHSSGFRSVNPWDEKEDEATALSLNTASVRMDNIERTKRHRIFWEKVRQKYERPSERPGTNSTWPLIVLQYSYVFDASWTVNMLYALIQQPIEFQKRVVIGCIESHLHSEDVALLADGWSANGLLPPIRQSSFRIVSLPYPISVTTKRDSFDFHAPPGHSSDSVNRSNQRPIKVLFTGSLDRGRSSHTGRLGQGNRVRGLVVRALQRHDGAVCAKDGCAVCTLGLERECEALILHQNQDRLWELAANSVFCLEPPGDTLTRSHFFVAAASGCIPVIFDGGDGSDLYSPHEPTHWPWRLVGTTKGVSHVHHEHRGRHSSGDKFRSTINQVGLDYTRFTVAVNVSEVLGLIPRPSLGFVERLTEMPSEEVEQLQQGLHGAASALLYAPVSTLAVPANNDAFARFFDLLLTPGILHGPHILHPQSKNLLLG